MQSVRTPPLPPTSPRSSVQRHRRAGHQARGQAAQRRRARAAGGGRHGNLRSTGAAEGSYQARGQPAHRHGALEGGRSEHASA